jgi:hypothetical protein
MNRPRHNMSAQKSGLTVISLPNEPLVAIAAVAPENRVVGFPSVSRRFPCAVDTRRSQL